MADVAAKRGRPLFWVLPLTTRARDIARLTAQSFWRGFLSFYDSDNLTYAASIAYYALLSIFPFFLLSLALLGRVTADAADRAKVLEFVLRYFPRQFDFITILQGSSNSAFKRQRVSNRSGVLCLYMGI